MYLLAPNSSMPETQVSPAKPTPPRTLSHAIDELHRNFALSQQLTIACRAYLVAHSLWEDNELEDDDLMEVGEELFEVIVDVVTFLRAHGDKSATGPWTEPKFQIDALSKFARENLK